MALYIKNKLKTFFPGLHHLYMKYKARSTSLEKKFSAIYDNNFWQGVQSKSGPGSELAATSEIIRNLPIIFNKFKIKTILDAACGDFNWMQHVNLDIIEKYIGVDIVPELITKNNQMYKNSKISFESLNITEEGCEQVDLIICRDCFVHLSFEKINNAIRNIVESGSKYLLSTSFLNIERNLDILDGEWRKINLLLPPFDFPKPMFYLDEQCPINLEKGRNVDKFLLLWNIKDIRVNSS